MKNKVRKISKKSIKDSQDSTDSMQKAAYKFLKSKSKGEALLPDDALIELNKRILKRRKQEQKNKKLLENE